MAICTWKNPYYFDHHNNIDIQYIIQNDSLAPISILDSFHTKHVNAFYSMFYLSECILYSMFYLSREHEVLTLANLLVMQLAIVLYSP